MSNIAWIAFFDADTFTIIYIHIKQRLLNVLRIKCISSHQNPNILVFLYDNRTHETSTFSSSVGENTSLIGTYWSCWWKKSSPLRSQRHDCRQRNKPSLGRNGCCCCCCCSTCFLFLPVAWQVILNIGCNKGWDSIAWLQRFDQQRFWKLRQNRWWVGWGGWMRIDILQGWKVWLPKFAEIPRLE